MRELHTAKRQKSNTVRHRRSPNDTQKVFPLKIELPEIDQNNQITKVY